MDLFEKFINSDAPLAQISHAAHGIGTYPKLAGDVSNRMMWRDREHIVWSNNNYLGLANLPEVRKAEEEFVRQYGLSAQMGSRMMTAETEDHEQLEIELADHTKKPATFVLNYGYQGMVSLIDAITSPSDWVVSDAENHACIIDGIRLHKSGGGQTRMFPHNDVDQLEARLSEIDRVREPDAGVLVVTEGVFGMSGDQGRIREIVELKKKYNFRLLVDDAHGYGAYGASGGGTGHEQGVQDGIDIYYSTLAKSVASSGSFVASEADVIWKLRYTMRSQIFSRGLPWPIVAGIRVRLQLLRTRDDLRKQAHAVASELQESLAFNGFDIGKTNSLITPVYLPMDPLAALTFLAQLREEHGIFCSAVTYPVVPPGIVQLRLIPTACHEIADVEPTVNGIASVFKKFTGRAL